ncbi:MAG: flagellar biosynthesis anti-sigma factor FlgM [Bacillota bacterium]
MSRINGVGNNTPIQKVTSHPVTSKTPTVDSKPLGSSDKLELSGMSHLLKSLKSNDIRTDKVAAVRAQIEAGTYENDQKLDTAIDRLLDDLNK